MVMKNKENLKNRHSLAEPRETRNVRWDPGWDPETEEHWGKPQGT